MEDKARLYAGHTEKVVFTGYEGGKPRYRRIRDPVDWLKIVLGLVLAIVLSIAAGLVSAEQEARAGTIVCNSIEELVEAIDATKAGEPYIPLVRGCRYVNIPWYAIVTELPERETERAIFKLATVDYGGGLILYGFTDFVMK